MKVRIEAPACNDLVQGYTFYEQNEEGLGEYFLASLYSDIESLRILGGIHPKGHMSLHRALSSKFPFAIYYAVQGEEVAVKAVLDCRRNPSWIRKKLKSV